MSHDEKPVAAGPRRFLIDVEETIRVVLEQEDTDGDFQISVTDAGPKLMALGTATSNGFKTFDVRGTYMLSNLLQELALARDHNRKRIVLDEARLTENPVDRLSRMIKHSFWHSLTRRIDGEGLEIICADPKNRTGRVNPRIYVPHDEPAMAEYYRKVAKEKPHLNLDVQVLPKKCDDPAFVKSLNNKPGILALAMDEVNDGKGGKTLKGIPFIVPGARFNEVGDLFPMSRTFFVQNVCFSCITGTPTLSLWDFWLMAKSTWPRVWSTTLFSRSSITARSSTAVDPIIFAELSLLS